MRKDFWDGYLKKGQKNGKPIARKKIFDGENSIIAMSKIWHDGVYFLLNTDKFHRIS